MVALRDLKNSGFRYVHVLKNKFTSRVSEGFNYKVLNKP